MDKLRANRSGVNRERHGLERSAWLRAAVLGANDGILSTASLLLGVAATEVTHRSVIVAGVAGLAAGAMSMAAGEYVSVKSQKDAETADLARESAELSANDAGEHRELAAIYVKRGLNATLAKQVAEQLMAHDALAAHARDELGISDALRAPPIQARTGFRGELRAGCSTAPSRGGARPLERLSPLVAGTGLLFLAFLGRWRLEWVGQGSLPVRFASRSGGLWRWR
jgi:VIT1/CCC1 family predicted Fe2+/Mn2+ transporter